LLESFLNTLVEELVLDSPPQQEERGTFLLQLNAQTAITLQELDPGISFVSQIGACPAERREELFMLLMKANLLGQGTGGAVIALDKEGNFLTLSRVLPYDMNYKTFRDALEDFANFLEYWKEELVRHTATTGLF